MPSLQKQKYDFTVVDGSQHEVPSWLSKLVGGKPRIWGQIILNYPLHLIRPSFESKNNPRATPPKVKIEKIKSRVKKYGFVGTLAVTPLYMDDATGAIVYEVLSGDCRRISLEELKYTVVNIEIYEGTEKELAPLRMALNMDSELHPADQADYIYNVLIKRYNYLHEQIADICSQSTKQVGRTWVTIMAGIAQNCIKDVMDAWRDNKIKQTHTIQIARFFTKADIEQQRKLLKYIIATKIKGSDLKRKLETSFSMKDKNEVIMEIRKELKTKVVTIPAKEKKEKTSSLLEPKAIVIKREKSPSIKKKNIICRPMFEIVRRYRELQEKKAHGIYDETTTALLKEYKWLLGKDS